mmetsp:Transcript_42268/g.106048  ORF Transcript_42268/g.106048 Transcript_42268/m.106048 type:complete len:319 (-) Transcript_42268:185-1141(-)
MGETACVAARAVAGDKLAARRAALGPGCARRHGLLDCRGVVREAARVSAGAVAPHEVPARTNGSVPCLLGVGGVVREAAAVAAGAGPLQEVVAHPAAAAAATPAGAESTAADTATTALFDGVVGEATAIATGTGALEVVIAHPAAAAAAATTTTGGGGGGVMREAAPVAAGACPLQEVVADSATTSTATTPTAAATAAAATAALFLLPLRLPELLGGVVLPPVGGVGGLAALGAGAGLGRVPGLAAVGARYGVCHCSLRLSACDWCLGRWRGASVMVWRVRREDMLLWVVSADAVRRSASTALPGCFDSRVGAGADSR